MKRNIALTIIITLALAAVAGSAPLALAKDYKALFIHWRGETPVSKGLENGLKENGLNVAITRFDADKKKENLSGYLSKLDESQYDFIYTFGTTGSLMTSKKVVKTPLFFGVVTSPVKSGLIKSWESSGNNITGVSHIVPYKDQVEFILTLGEFKKIGIIFDPKAKNSQIAKAELTKYCQPAGIEVVPATASQPSEIAAALKALKDAKVDMVYLPSDSFIADNAKQIVDGLTAAKIPTYGALEKIVKDGGAMIGIVSNYEVVGRILAGKVAKVLKEGKQPSQVPSGTVPMDMQTVLVQAPTVTKLGIEIPYQILEMATILK
jgi:putative ABC transport system substrate-binding protein